MLQTKSRALTILFLAVFSQCNVWDNIYSQAQASTPILLSDSMTMDFSVKEYNSNGNIDFNSNLQTITLTLYFDLLLVRVELFKAQLDMQTLIVTIKGQGKSCQRIKPAFLAKADINTPQISKERLFLINLFFKFEGVTVRKQHEYNKYKFAPNLLGTNSTNFMEYAKVITDQLDKNTKDQIEKLNLSNDTQIYLYTDTATGGIYQVALVQGQTKKQTNLPFKLFSTVSKHLECSSPVRQLSNEEIKEMIETIIKNKGSFDKIFK